MNLSASDMPGGEITAALAGLTSAFSIEVTPRDAHKVADFTEHLRPGTAVYVTHLANLPFASAVETVRRLAADGMRPVPHLAARAIRDERHLDEMLAALAGEGGVEEILLIAGSVSRPAGNFDASIQVLRSGRLEGRGIRRVGLAGHPEGNKDIGEERLRQALAEKNAFAVSSGLDLYLMSQFCFLPGPILEWEERTRSEGNRLPVRVGLPGLASPATLLKFGLSCGIGPSLTVLRKHSGNLLRLAASPTYYPDKTMLGVARATVNDPECLVRGFHFFPFGAFAKTAAWANSVRDGQFTLDTSTEHLEVTA